MPNLSLPQAIQVAFQAVAQVPPPQPPNAAPDFHKREIDNAIKSGVGVADALTGGSEGFDNLITKPIRDMLENAGLNKEQIDRVMTFVNMVNVDIPVLRPVATLFTAALVYPGLFISLSSTLGQIIAKPVYNLLRPAEHDLATLDRLLLRRLELEAPSKDWQPKAEDVRKAIDAQAEKLKDAYGVIGEPQEKIAERLEANRPILSASEWIDLYIKGWATRADAAIALAAMGYSTKDIDRILSPIRTPLGADRLFELKDRGLVDKWEKSVDWFRRQGIIGDEEKEGLEYLSKNVPNMGDLRDWVNRGAIKETDFDRFAKAAGFGNPLLHPEFKQSQLSNLETSDGDPIRALMRSSAWQVPTLKDLVQFAVKDAFDPKVSKKFSLFDEFPGFSRDPVDSAITSGMQAIAPKVAKAKTIGDAYTAFCEASGVSQPQAMLEWASHWNLPAPGQVFDMFFRGAIDQDAVNDYLKAADYSKFWRDKMLAIQYNEPSRTDLEAMYTMGVINGNAVKTGLERLGYSSDNAANLAEMIRRRVHTDLIYDAIDNVLAAYRRDEITLQEARALLKDISPSEDYTLFALQESTIKREVDKKLVAATGTVRQVEEVRNLAKTDIVRALRADVINDATAVKMLKEIGYEESAAEFIVAQQRFSAAIDSRSSSVNLIEKQYLAGVIDDAEATRQLSSLGLPVDVTARHLFDFKFAKQAQDNLAKRQDKPATVAELNRWLKKGLLTPEEWMNEMRKTGLTDFVIRMHLSEYLLTLEETE